MWPQEQQQEQRQLVQSDITILGRRRRAGRLAGEQQGEGGEGEGEETGFARLSLHELWASGREAIACELANSRATFKSCNIVLLLLAKRANNNYTISMAIGGAHQLASG